MRFSALWLVALFAQALLAAEMDTTPLESSTTDPVRNVHRLGHALAAKFGVEPNQVFYVPALDDKQVGEFLIRGFNISCKEEGRESSQAQVLCLDAQGERVGGLTAAEVGSALRPVLR